MNARLTATDHFRKVCQKIYSILCSVGPTLHILCLRLEENLFFRSFCHMSTMVILCLLVLIPHR
jgi:hypothetical protein